MTFASPWFLLYLLGIGIPIYLHLYFQKKPILKEFPSLRLIRKSVEHLARRKKVRNLVLMALRIAIVVFAVLFFSRPFWGGTVSDSVSGQNPSAFVVLLDTSMSMSSTSQGITAFNTGKAKALELIDQMGENDRATVGFINEPGGLAFPQLTWDKKTLKDTINMAETTFGGTNLSDSIFPAIQILEPLKNYRKAVFVITDMTKTSWQPFLNKFEPDKIDKNIDLVLVPVVSETISNTAITSLKINEPVVMTGRETTISLKTANYSDNLRKIRTTIAINNEIKADKELELEANTEKETEFKITFSQSGMNNLTANITSDSMPADNTRTEAIKVFNPCNILLVKPDTPQGMTSKKEEIFVKFALNPLNRSKNNIFNTETRTTSETENLSLDKYSAVIIINQRHLNEKFVKTLSEYVSNGGNLITFLGDKTEPEWYNENLNASLGDKYLLPAKLFKRVGNAVSKNTIYKLTDLETDHPSFSAFKDNNSGDISTANIYEFFQIQPNSKAIILCKMNHGFPGIVEEKRGYGNSMLITFSPDTAWSNWPTKPTWLPFLHGTLIYMITSNELTINSIRPGMTISANLPKDKTENLELILPNKEKGKFGKVEINNNFLHITSKDTELSGYYELTSNGSTLTAFAVNPPADESHLEKIPIKDIPRFKVLETDNINKNMKEKVTALQNGYDLSGLFMILLLITAILEHYLANAPSEKRAA